MGNFRERKLLQIDEKYDFRGEMDCSLLPEIHKSFLP